MTRTPHVFVVAYDFPPHGAIGTMRTLRLVRYLDRAGWRVTVLTGDPATFLPGTPVEPGLLERVPPAVEVLRARAARGGADRRPAGAEFLRETGTHGSRPRPARPPLPRWARRAKDWVDFATRIPDRERPWIRPAVELAQRFGGSDAMPDILFSSAPPWSGQLVALELARAWNIPWVADFRDPWGRAPWREDRPRYTVWAAQRLERRVVERASAVVFTTKGNHDEFSRHYGEGASTRFHLVPNGCDPEEFDGLDPIEPPQDQFTLLHAGSLYGARNPVPLLEAMAQLRSSGELGDRFHLRLLGSVNPAGVDVAAVCDKLGLAHVVEMPGRVPRVQSLREMLGANALLLVQPGTAVAVPAKVYEYVAAGRPILALTDEGETPDLVRQSGLGVVAPPADVPAIVSALREVVCLVAQGVNRPPRTFYDGNLRAGEVAAILTAQLREDATTENRNRTPGALPIDTAGASR